MLIGVLLLWLALAVPIHSAGASEVGSCGFTSNALRNEVGAGGPRIDAIQKGLAAVFSGRPAFDPDVRNGPLRDQVLGRRTQSWIGTFCDEFKPARTTDRIATVEAALHHYANIAMAHEDWRDAIRGGALETWLQELPSAEERWLQLSGPAASVINLLDVFAGLPSRPHDSDVADIAYQQIGAAHLNWRVILASTSFRDWVRADKSGMRALRRSGSPPIVIGLLDEYAIARPPIDACSTTPPDDTPEDAVYYRLEAANIKSLAARAQRQPALQALVGQTFDKKSDLIEAVAEALPTLAATCPPDVFATIVAGPSDEVAVGAVLDAGSMNRLTLKNLPADHLRAISILEGRVFATRKDLAEAVRFRIDEALLVSSLEPAAGPPLPMASPEPEAAAVTPPPPEGQLDATPTPTAPPVAGGDPEPEHTSQQSSHQSGGQQQGRGLAAGADDGYDRYDCPGCKPVTPKQVDRMVEEAVSVYGLSTASAARLAQMADAVPAPAPLPELDFPHFTRRSRESR